ncbi:Zeta toxin family protein [Pleurostoma richardsiae]|uniref:Zeta toxin family protein n=1 Tax=Pleurostoma richardsiae TaxID=41990 RepID=A0AA38VNJ2_9PEZI|nr:Zeta toxin family protein [Pleurostoma richardsiae]
MASVAKHYRLPEEDSQRIFHEQIVPQEFKHLEGVQPDNARQPIAAFIVGQTGAGKTRIAPGLQTAFQNLGRTHAHFIADTYKTYHPQYLDIVKVRPDLASPATGPDARKWLEMACRYAAEHRYDALVESACRHPDDFSGLIKAFRDTGYRVCVAVLAVPEALSLLGIVVRYYQQLPEAQSGNLPLRLTPLKVHDDSYAGLLAAADVVDRSDLVDHVIVVRRGNLVAYANSRSPAGEWIQPAGARSALDLERVRPLLDRELSTALADLSGVEQFKDAKEKKEIADRLYEVERLLSAVQVHGQNIGPFPELQPLDSTAFLEGIFSVSGIRDETAAEAEPEVVTDAEKDLTVEEKLAHDDP